MSESRAGGALNGAAVIDRKGHKIGKVVDVFHDLVSGSPEWVAVKTGALSAKKPFVPIQGTYRADNGDLVVPFDKETIAHAPHRDSGVAPTRHEAEELLQYYDLTTPESNQ